MNKKLELLAPAGTKDAFIGAINAGANAIYLAGKEYGARKFANNFTRQEIVELIKYAHLRNVKVFVTINTLIYESELKELFDYSDFLVSNNVDALIVQDLGVIHNFVRRYPNSEIHASTQMNVFNVHQAKYLKNIGVKRIILARETSIDTIKQIKKEVDIDLEVFVHGALCVAYSGNCLFSSMTEERSGNRGECAQNCRMRYSLHKGNKLISDKSYLLSAKDLMTLDNLHEIIDSGVISLKIEGRMKSPEYVVTTVKAYKKAINNKNIETKDLEKDLKKVFNRQYTKGYILNEKPFNINNSYRPNHIGIIIGTVTNYYNGKTTIRLEDTLSLGDGIRVLGDRYDFGDQVNKIMSKDKKVSKAFKGESIVIDFPKKVKVGSKVVKTQDKAILNQTQEYLKVNYKLIALEGKLCCNVGEPLKLTLQNNFSKEITVISDYIVEPAKKAGVTEEKLYSQINKLGNTHYYLDDFEIQTDSNGFVPNIVLNNLRRDTLEKLEESILSKNKISITKPKSKDVSFERKNTLDLICKVETKDQLKACNELNIETIYQTENLLPKNNLITNRIWFEKDNYLNKSLIIRDIGLLDIKTPKTTDYTMNVVNSLTIDELLKNGVNNITMSLESSIYNTEKVLSNLEKKYKKIPDITQVVYGKTDLMLSKYCPITKSYGVNKLDCNLCMQRDHYLRDDKDNEYKIIRDGYCNIRILHSKRLNLIKYIEDLKNMGVNTFRLDFTDESYYETTQIIKAFLNKINKSNYNLIDLEYTTGRFLR